MRSQSFMVLAAAALMGLLAVVIANFALDDEPQRAQPSAQPAGLTTVVVAKVPLYFGSKIGAEQLREVRWPADAVPPGAFTTVAAATAGEQRIALRPMETNEPVLASKVSGKGGRLSMSGLIAPDKRAATIRVNDVIGVAGFLLPGDRVDVMITRQADGQGAQPFTDVLLQNVRVVGVDQDANEAKDKPALVKTITVEVSQTDAQKLALAQQVGSLSLALRNLANLSPERPRTVRIADLRDGATTAPPSRIVYRTASRPARARAPRSTRAPQPRNEMVQVVRGVAESSYQVERHAGL